MRKEIGVALLGLGTVGTNVLKIIQENEAYFEEEYHIHFQVYFVYVRDVNKKRNVPLDNIIVTDDIEQIIHSSGVHICIECMGGSAAEKTYDIIMRLMQKGKHLIMSSKKCLACYQNEIVDMANQQKIQLRYDATVGGSIPICRMFQSLSGYDSVQRIWGIANATTNYVLTQMYNEGIILEEALEKAREAGYAENDVSEDIDGWDALYKMCILLRFGAGIYVNPGQLEPIGLEAFLKQSDGKAREKVKQIFYAEKTEDNRLRYYVGPAVFPSDALIGCVEEQNNVIFAEHKYGGVRAYYGAGAGGKETAAIMVEDLLDSVLNPVLFKVVKDCVIMQEILQVPHDLLTVLLS